MAEENRVLPGSRTQNHATGEFEAIFNRFLGQRFDEADKRISPAPKDYGGDDVVDVDDDGDGDGDDDGDGDGDDDDDDDDDDDA